MGMLLDLVTGAAQTGQKILADEREREGRLADRKAELDHTSELTMKREVAVAALKAQMEEAAAQRDARTKIAADERGAQTLEEAQFQKFKKDLGQSDASDEELRKVFAEQYFDRSVAPGDANSDRFNPRDSEFLRSGRDAALKMGASSGLLKQYDTELKDQRGAERLADDNARKERNDERRWQIDGQRMDIAQQRADAATATAAAAVARAERGGSGGQKSPAEIKAMTSMDIERSITAAKEGIAVELGIPTADVTSKIGALKKSAKAGNAEAKAILDSIQPQMKLWSDLRARQTDLTRNQPDGKKGESESKPDRNTDTQKTASTPPLDRLTPGKVTTFANGERWKLGSDGKPQKVN